MPDRRSLPRELGQHTCPAPECSATVPDSRYACSRDWFRLPSAIRWEIWLTAKLSPVNTRRGEVLVAAATWYRENPRGT